MQMNSTHCMTDFILPFSRGLTAYQDYFGNGGKLLQNQAIIPLEKVTVSNS